MSNGKGNIDWSTYAHRAAKRKGSVISTGSLAGRSTRAKGEEEVSKYGAPGLYAVCWATVIAIIGILLRRPVIVFLAVCLAIVGLSLIRESIFRAYSWLKGARGEKAVATALRSLECERFQVLHDLPNGKGNIDHVVIGRTGVFVIETKAHEGSVHYQNGRLCKNGFPFDRDPLKQVRRQAACLADKIEPIIGRRPYVIPILCFVNAYVENDALTVENVTVTRPQFLTKMITRGKAKFSQPEVERMAEALRD